MALDFDTLRRMWRCHSIRIASFYHLPYEIPKDMTDLWKKMEKSHSICEYHGKPPFPIKKTPEEATQYIEKCASAFLQYKENHQKQVDSINTIRKRVILVTIILFILLGFWYTDHVKNYTTYFWIMLFIIFMILFYKKIRKQKKHDSKKKKIFFYKDTPENDVSYIEKHLPPNFEYTKDIEKCDFILSTKFTWGVEGFEPHQSFLKEYGKQPKKVIVFWITDSNDIFEVPPNVYFFRTSLYRRWRNPTEDVLPFVFEPFEKKDFKIFPTASKPIIGFCGGAWSNRKKTLDQFRNDGRFETLYIEHQHFLGGTREMYMENIQNSHFTICDRGRGNFTMRMWHVLCLGRVPILVEEDTIFPFYKEIDWDQICVRARNPQELAEKTILFYNTRNMEQVQKSCFETYQKYFTQENYLNKIFSTIL